MINQSLSIHITFMHHEIETNEDISACVLNVMKENFLLRLLYGERVRAGIVGGFV